MDSAEVKRLLTQLDLNEYIKTFEENNISYDTLLQLDNSHVRELLPRIGDQIKLCAAIDKIKKGDIYTGNVPSSESVEKVESLFEGSLISSNEARCRGLQLPPELVKSFKQNPATIQTPQSKFMQVPQIDGTPVQPLIYIAGDNLSENVNCHEHEVIHYEIIQDTAAAAQPEPDRSTEVQGKKYYGFNIEEVLLKDFASSKVLTTKLPQKKLIISTDRRAIAAALIDKVISTLGTSPSKVALEQLAKDLVLLFPGLGDPRKEGRGYEMWFFHSHHGLGASGFLEDRLKNQRKKVTSNKKTQLNTESLDATFLDWSSEIEDENPTPDEKELEFLRQNHGQEIKIKMKETVFQRRTFIRQQTGVDGLLSIIKCMPRLVDTEGMIIQDFDVRHPKLALILYDKWPKVSKLLMDYAEECGIDFADKIGVKKSRYELLDDDFQLLAFALLPYILPSCGKKLKTGDDKESDAVAPAKKGTRKQAKVVKGSDKDSMASMIQFRSVSANFPVPF
ncbi:Sterile alpha motif domain-containing protein 3 [Folsomia candida]|uniref:Sterile alpha motif domain-containing protein 3 n=1 Tax=Folsomia candida TaxID=158441 RepID=A0A226DCX9_FOLCA|nr:Sterile alpha motif domain-containing protein 3 [Folsomia candida]